LTEKETFRHILLHLNHTFLFGLTAGPLPPQPDVTSLAGGFLAGRKPLSEQAAIVDRASKELRDKDHCYYFGQSGAVYNVAGRKVAQGNNHLPDTKEEAAAVIPGHRLHEQTAVYQDAQARQIWLDDGSSHYFLSEDTLSQRFMVYLLPGGNTPSLRLPNREGDDPHTAEANKFLQQGYVPLPHHFRRGGKNISWYRSPLLAGKADKHILDDQFPVHTADELLRYDSAYGMFDTSYAAAWSLGRLLCLKNKRVSWELYRWKRTHVRLLKTMEQQHLHPHLPFRANGEAVVLPENVEQWLAQIKLLKGLPFSYLVPDERMLPLESLRFFYLDSSWIASLVDGALSIGRVNKGHDTAVHKQSLTDSGQVDSGDVITGFLLRSSVVKGWPTLQVNAYDFQFEPGSDAVEDKKNENIPPGNELKCVRLERLSDNVLLGLFDGEIEVLDIHEQPETVHFGFDYNKAESKANQISKFPRTPLGRESDKDITPTALNDFYDEGNRIIRPLALAEAIKSENLGYDQFTSAQFALSMIEGVSRVRFIRA
jgi:hypothetical protein